MTKKLIKKASIDKDDKKQPKKKVINLQDTKQTLKFEISRYEMKGEKKIKRRNSLENQGIKGPQRKQVHEKRASSKKSLRQNKSSSKRKQQKVSSYGRSIEAKFCADIGKLKKTSTKNYNKGYQHSNQVALKKDQLKKREYQKVTNDDQLYGSKGDGRKGLKKANDQDVDLKKGTKFNYRHLEPKRPKQQEDCSQEKTKILGGAKMCNQKRKKQMNQIDKSPQRKVMKCRNKVKKRALSESSEQSYPQASQ